MTLTYFLYKQVYSGVSYPVYLGMKLEQTGSLQLLQISPTDYCNTAGPTKGVLGWSVGAKLGKVVIYSLVEFFHLLLEDVLLVQEENDGHCPQPPVIPDALKKLQRLS